MSFSNITSNGPRIMVFAGPNGSGKSTVTKNVPIVGTYINADDIKRSRSCDDLSAAVMAESIRERFLAARQSFTFETVLSTTRNLDLLQRAKDAGFLVSAVFVLTCDSNINVQRVRERVSKGGHSVPEDKIVSRYEKSLRNIAALVRIADQTIIIDNSAEKPQVICEVEGTSVRVFESACWSKQAILSLVNPPEKADRG